MNHRSILSAFALVALAAPAGPLAAQATDSARIAELERQVEAITRQLERVSLGEDVVQADSSVQGLGPAASRVYRIDQGVSIGGYGELLYERFAAETEAGSPADAANRFDALRAILYVGYKFNDRLLFNSEIEVEHADEVSLEFAYLDYGVTDDVGVRAGLLLAPLGLVNELHEPPVYLGTTRSVTETRIIPTTWRENGIGLFGDAGPFAWRAYLMNSLDAAGFDGTGLRGGRQKGSKALANDFGIAGRFDYVATPGLIVGASSFVGKTTHGEQLDGRDVGGRIVVWDLHADLDLRGWDLRALVAGAQVDEAAELNRLNGLTGANGLGTAMLGWYVEAGYDVLRDAGTSHQLLPYVRYERVNTQREVAPGYASDPSNDLTVTSLGVSWKPVPQVVGKIGYQVHSNKAETGVSQLNFQIGWLF